MGSAVSSAYGKVKGAVSSALLPAGSEADPVSLSSKPTSLGPELYVANGQLYESSGQYAKALDAYSKALEIEPRNSPALLSMARLYNRENDLAKSIEFFKKASEINPQDAQTYSELGSVYLKQSQLAAAKEEFKKAIALQPKNRDYRIALAGVLVDEGRGDAALDELAQVESPAMAHYRLAYVYFARQNIPATQQHLQYALQIDPNLQPARELANQLGTGQFAQNARGSLQTAGNIINTTNSLISTQRPVTGAPATPPGTYR